MWLSLVSVSRMTIMTSKVDLKSVLKTHSQVIDNFWQLKALLKMMNNTFSFTLKFLFVLEIFQFLFWGFGPEQKRLDKKADVNLKSYDVTNRITNNYNTDIATCRKK